MLEQSNITKSKKSYFSIIFWLALIIFAYFSFQYLLSEWHYRQAKNKAGSQFSNIESIIYKTKEGNQIDETANQKHPKLDDSPINLNEVLLKQQLQISQLQNDYNALKLDTARFKLGDSLSNIILSFVKLRDMIDLKMNYDEELQRLELLSSKDQNLVHKIEKLKLVLQKQPKNRMELFEEFNGLIPKIIIKVVSVQNNGGLVGKIKENIAKFIIIKRVGESNKSSLEISIANVQNAINAGDYTQALSSLNSIDGNCQETLLVIKSDLENAINLQVVGGDIYRYLVVMSDNTIHNQ